MESKEVKPKTNKLKNWWRDWAKFDLTILPTGVSLAYFLKDYANGFWLNLSTELLGAYISVRIIDYFLKRTEKRHSDRRSIVNNVYWFYESADKLLPYVDEWRVRELQQEIKYFDLQWEEKKQLLDKDEICLVEEIRLSREQIVSLALEHVNHLVICRKLESEISDSFPERPKWWRQLEDRFHEYQRTLLDSESILKALDEAGKGIDQRKLPGEALKALTAYMEEFESIGKIRGGIALEVRNHEELSYKLRNNIHQESG